jgi:hypothetical protein
LYYLSNILYERSMWLCKRKNIIKKWTSVQSMKTMGTLMPA